MVVQQIDFVDIEKTAVSRRQNAGVETALAFLNSRFDIQRTHHAVFGSGNGQVHEGRAAQCDRQLFAAFYALTALGAPGFRMVRVAGKAAVFYHPHLRQQGSQSTRGRRFGRAAFAADQYTTDARFDRV